MDRTDSLRLWVAVGSRMENTSNVAVRLHRFRYHHRFATTFYQAWCRGLIVRCPDAVSLSRQMRGNGVKRGRGRAQSRYM